MSLESECFRNLALSSELLELFRWYRESKGKSPIWVLSDKMTFWGKRIFGHFLSCCSRATRWHTLLLSPWCSNRMVFLGLDHGVLAWSMWTIRIFRELSDTSSHTVLHTISSWKKELVPFNWQNQMLARNLMQFQLLHKAHFYNPYIVKWCFPLSSTLSKSVEPFQLINYNSGLPEASPVRYKTIPLTLSL